MASGYKSRRMLHLARKWREGSITEAEKKEFDEWFDAFDDTELEMDSAGNEDMLKERLYARIKERSDLEVKQPVRRLYTRIVAAASILLILSAGGYFVFRKHAAPVQIAQNNTKEITPGINKATLTLSDGRKMVLTDAQKGTIASQGNTLIKKTEEGKVEYITSANGPGSETLYNTLSTKRAEQYSLTLPDGSKVWLNSASSIHYPVSFAGAARTVELTGEAYFEVVHNPAQPFRVKVNGGLIEDIGTAFNVNAYEDEPVITTTLISGAVRVNHQKQSVLLKPSQAALSNAALITVKDVDTEGAVAWRKGYFLFDHEELHSVMRKISRWYNVDIEYPNDQQVSERYWGSVSRFVNVSEVLTKLQQIGHVKFKVEGNKIIVQNN
ncbi:FecR family protein [Mucilaginibacter sp. Mucisp84]|uniref:FecR family protein n=1 Tax=Mucilaginibacter sp. Mucisp84 TaxID=3243058 RepID=UPI0039A49A11